MNSRGVISESHNVEGGGTSTHLRVLLAVLGVSLVWVLFAKLVVPPIIDSAYRGESWPFLNRMILGQAHNPVDYYLRKWDRLILTGLLSFLGFYVIALVISRPAVTRRIVGEATPGTLGAIRMWVCAILLLTTLWEDLGSIAWLPPELRHPRGVLRYLYVLPFGLQSLVTSELGLRVFQLLTELLLFLGMIGWRSRIVMPAATFCYFLLLGILIDYSFFWHQNLVPFYVMIVLCFTPCGDGWSVDRLQKIYQGRPVPDAQRPSAVYGWARYACWAMIALPYVTNGLSKLVDGGFFWWDPSSMKAHIYGDSLTPREYDFAPALYLVHGPDVVFAVVGIFALFSETLFGFVLISRIARRIFPLAAVGMHTGIFLLQRILFFDLILLQLVFFDLTPLRKAVSDRLAARRGRLEVLYDGLCPLCRRTIRVLTALDLFGRLECVDFRQLNLDDYNRRRGLALRSADLEEEMVVVSRGRSYRGFYGYRRIALALPAFWPLAPWLFLPGVSSVGEAAYRYVAVNRLRLLRCDSNCPTEPAERVESVTTSSTRDRARAVAYALAVSTITIGALLCWYYRIEFYPFTSWHLYSNLDTSGKVEYYKVFAVHESGLSSRARLEDTIGALALDGRYSPHLEKCFSEQPRDLELCTKFLTAAASAYNKKAPPGQKVTQYEVQLWFWDFRNHPLDPKYGSSTDEFALEIGTGKARRRKIAKDTRAGDSSRVTEGLRVEGSDAGDTYENRSGA